MVSVEYEATDENLLASALKNEPESTEEEILNTYHRMADGVNGTFGTAFNFTYALEKINNGWIITNADNTISTSYYELDLNPLD